MLFLNTFVPALKEASSEVQGALQQTNPGVDSKSISYLLCSDRQQPFGTSQDRGHLPLRMFAQLRVASGRDEWPAGGWRQTLFLASLFQVQAPFAHLHLSVPHSALVDLARQPSSALHLHPDPDDQAHPLLLQAADEDLLRQTSATLAQTASTGNPFTAPLPASLQLALLQSVS